MPSKVDDIRAGQTESRFEERIGDYNRWKSELSEAIQSCQQWLQAKHLDTPELDLRIFDILEALRGDRLTVAFVAEFSRGKSELINAIFFSDYKRRLLPSAAGRTTMCPTELFYDAQIDQDYIRLLPIETRLENTSIAEYKRDTSAWKTLYLDTKSPDAMEESMREVVKTKMVPVAEAERLGLVNKEELSQQSDPPAEVEIPVWRHALISFHHPLLMQGLSILDTPGLNAMGSEPELTLSMIPSAQAVLFLLAADTGVTRSDMEMWQQHISRHNKSLKLGLMAALNKIDVLWDEMKTGEQVDHTIEEQRLSAAKQLNIAADRVFPISAQKALVAKSKGDKALLGQSGITVLENHLADVILPTKQHIIWDSIVGDVTHAIDNIYNGVRSNFDKTDEELKQFQSMCGKNVDVFQKMMNKTRQQQAVYLKDVENFQASHRRIVQQSKVILNTLSPESIDKLIAETRKHMVESWTTVGLKKEMTHFFDSINDTLQIVSRQIEQTYDLVMSIFQKFHEEHGFPQLSAKPFPLSKYNEVFQKLSQEAEVFRTSKAATLYEQSFVVKKFFISLVSHVRNQFITAHKEVEVWLKEMVNPLVRQIKENRTRIEQQLQNLAKINDSRTNLEGKITEVEKQCKELRELMNGLDAIRDALNKTKPAASPDAQNDTEVVEEADAPA
jgi:hypothetical protein